MANDGGDMFWEELTSDEFAIAVKEVEGVCLVPLSCIERHAHHLPLGTDMYIGREMCRRAAQLEPAIIFPDLIFTQILEAQQCAGTIATDPDVMILLASNIIREIARNGFKKIILVNAHGGNRLFMGFLTQMELRTPHESVLYAWNPQALPEDREAMRALWEPMTDGHAGAGETAQIMAIRPDLVRISELKADGEGMPLGRLNALREAGLFTGFGWYADHPTHYSGDGSPATKEKGEQLLDAVARALAHAVKVVKQDTVSQQLQDEFFAAAHGH
jgi:creatinine amidohydrolase